MAEEVPWGVASARGTPVWAVMATTAEGAAREWARHQASLGRLPVDDSEGVAVRVFREGLPAGKYVVRVTVRVEKGED